MTAVPEYIWLAFDWSQAEVYTMACASKDENLKADLLSKDFHREVASNVFSCTPEQVTSEQREMAKVVTYRLLYTGLDLDLSKSVLTSQGIDDVTAEQALNNYAKHYPAMFSYIEKVLMDWYHSNGEVRYLLNQKKICPVNEWLKEDLAKIRQDKEARVAVNTINQNSVGLLMKLCYSHIFQDRFLMDNTTQHIPVFDAFYCLVNTRSLGKVLTRLNHIFTPVLTNGDFSIRMAGEWKASLKSMGELKHIEVPSDPEAPITYQFF